MGRWVDTDDLIDAQGVADLLVVCRRNAHGGEKSVSAGQRAVKRPSQTRDTPLGLAQRNTVSSYQRRYPDMPRSVVDLGRGRCKMWLRSEVLLRSVERQAR